MAKVMWKGTAYMGMGMCGDGVVSSSQCQSLLNKFRGCELCVFHALLASFFQAVPVFRLYHVNCATTGTEFCILSQAGYSWPKLGCVLNNAGQIFSVN